MLKTITAALALGACALTLASGAPAAVEFGANDDTGKFLAEGSASYFGRMASAGLRQNVMTLKWDPAAPMTIADRAMLDAALPVAHAAGIKVVFALYGAKPTTFTGDRGSPAAFAAWAGQVARTYPAIRTFIVGNEPNQPRFWRPQFDARGKQVSAAAFGRVLAAAYDALKAVNPANRVVGIGLSPRGNDRPNAPSNVSSSPVRFLKALGDWFRASGRTRPVMDDLSFHPYPNANSDPLTRGYVWPNAGVPNLDRIKQALYDAFHGTGQPTTLRGLGLMLDEVGWQVDTDSNTAYSGAENVTVTTEAEQARIYGALARRVACDAAVKALNIFGFVDEGDRGAGFQAGLVRRDGTGRPSLSAFRRAIAAGCSGGRVSWSPERGVVGGGAVFNDSSPKTPLHTAWNVNATAAEDVHARVGLYRVKDQAGRRCTPGRVSFLSARQRGTSMIAVDRQLAVQNVEIDVKAGRTPSLRLRKQALQPGCYFYAMELTAAMNEERRSTFVSKGFLVGAAAKPAEAAKQPVRPSAKK